jgi:hypothetical protein
MANLLTCFGEMQLPINVSGARRAFRNHHHLLSRLFDFAPREKTKAPACPAGALFSHH